MKHFLNLCRNLLFPPKCAACGALLDWNDAHTFGALCEDCRRRWESEKADGCEVCAKRVCECTCMTAAMERAKCAGFRKLVFYRHGKRQHVQNRLIFHVKTSNDRQTPRFCASELLPALRSLTEGKPYTVLTYVPRSRAARLEYGTDQAKALAGEISRQSGIPCYQLLRRKRGKNRAQKKLGVAERYRNARRSYAPNSKDTPMLASKTVFLVDDMVTTGVSMAVCASILYRMGAREVHSLAVASDVINREPKAQ